MVMKFLKSITDPNPNAQFFGDDRKFKLGGSPKMPAAPDPAVTAAAQTAQNKETAWYNAQLENMDQITPYGNLTYQQTGTVDAPKWTSTVSLSPEQQKLYDTMTSADNALAQLGLNQVGRITESVSNPYSYAGLGAVNDYATAAENAIYSRLNPQFAQDEEAMRTRLINQGIGQGSQAYQREMDTFNQMKNDARMQAVLQGQQYGLAGRNQEIREYDAQRNAPLNEFIGLTSGTQVTNPSFASGGNTGMQGVDYAGLVNQNYQNQMAQYNAKQAGSNNMMSGLFGLGGSFLGAAGSAGGVAPLFAGLSDVRLKKDILPLGTENGFPVYKFKYDTDHDYVRHVNLPDTEYIGVMAQDVEKVMPEAVFELDGFKRVNYAMIGVEMREAI